MNEELILGRELAVGSKGPDVRRVQEWLNLHGYGLAIDGDFGRVSEDGVRRFQKAKRIRQTGRVDKKRYDHLPPVFRNRLEQHHRFFGEGGGEDHVPVSARCMCDYREFDPVHAYVVALRERCSRHEVAQKGQMLVT